MARDFSKNTSNFMTLGVGGLNNLLSGASAVTLVCWAQFDSPIGTGATNNRLICEFATGTSSSILLNVGNATPKFVVNARSQSADTLQTKTGTTTITTGGWWHLAGVIDYAGGTVTPYVNGAAEGGGAATFGSSTYAPGSPTGHAAIGSALSAVPAPTSTGDQVDGRIAEVAAWRAALTAGELAALAAGVSPLRIRPASLVLYMPFHGVASPERSLVGNTPSGTITGSLPQAAHPPAMAPFGGNEDWAPYIVSSTTSTGSGAITLSGLSVAGVGRFTARSSGAVTLGSVAVAGVGRLTASASGAVTLASLTPSGSGTFKASSSGAITLSAMSVAGSGSFSTSAAGSVALAALAVDGDGTAAAPGNSTGSGSVTLSALGVAGSGSFRASASGAVSLGSLAASGSGSFSASGSGDVTLAAMQAEGVATLEASGSGSVTLAGLAADGSATGGPATSTGSGSIVLSGLSASGVADGGGPPATFEGDDVQSAIQAWWQSRADLRALTSDGKLWHVKASEDVGLPYVVFFAVAEPESDRTTAYAVMDAVVQFNAFAELDADAAALRNAIRDAVRDAPLSVGGDRARHVLPAGQMLTIGEGAGPEGTDCWMASIEVEIPWERH
jgi:hypothetical protein